MGINDAYWKNYEDCLDEIRDGGVTVDDVMRICNAHYPPSSTEAFFPGGADRSLFGVLFPGGADRSLFGVLRWERMGWQVVWSEADYYWCMYNRDGDRLSYIEGDLQRGNCKSRT